MDARTEDASEAAVGLSCAQPKRANSEAATAVRSRGTPSRMRTRSGSGPGYLRALALKLKTPGSNVIPNVYLVGRKWPSESVFRASEYTCQDPVVTFKSPGAGFPSSGSRVRIPSAALLSRRRNLQTHPSARRPSQAKRSCWMGGRSLGLGSSSGFRVSVFRLGQSPPEFARACAARAYRRL